MAYPFLDRRLAQPLGALTGTIKVLGIEFIIEVDHDSGVDDANTEGIEVDSAGNAIQVSDLAVCPRIALGGRHNGADVKTHLVCSVSADKGSPNVSRSQGLSATNLAMAPTQRHIGRPITIIGGYLT
jgi:hypothetical protein